MVTITEHSTEGKNMKMKDLKNHFLLLQINDSLFPIGGYSHSYGLETYIQKGIVHNSELAAEYIRKRLLYNFLYTDFLAVRLAYDAALQEDETAIDELEDQMEASRIPSELREASRKLGSRFIKTLLHMQITPPSGFSPATCRYAAEKPPAIPVLTVFCAPAWGWIGRRFCPPFSMPRPPRWSPTA